MSETTIEEQMDETINDLFDEFLSNYELDSEASIADMLYEFYAEGFIKALEVMNEEIDSEEAEEEA